MLKIKLSKFQPLLALTIMILTVVSCSKDDPVLVAEVSVNGTVLIDNGDDFNGDIDGDFNGDGGSDTRTFTWQNSFATADYNADITSSTGGTFKFVVKDADENVVLDRSLEGGASPDSFSGVTMNGMPGIWSVTITLTSFNGDGSFSLSEGD